MHSPELLVRLLRASEIFRNRGLTQEDLASHLGFSQSQVSRVLACKAVRHSKLAEEICLYAESLEDGVTLKAVRDNTELLEAVRQAWDGSAAHARALSTVIRSLAVLGSRPTSTREKGRR